MQYGHTVSNTSGHYCSVAAEKRKLELAQKFRKLEQSGKLEQFIAKKKKKNVRTEQKSIPHT